MGLRSKGRISRDSGVGVEACMWCTDLIVAVTIWRCEEVMTWVNVNDWKPFLLSSDDLTIPCVFSISIRYASVSPE